MHNRPKPLTAKAQRKKDKGNIFEPVDSMAFHKEKQAKKIAARTAREKATRKETTKRQHTSKRTIRRRRKKDKGVK